MNKQVIIQIEIEGFHFYKNAPDKVSFLRDKHRHNFKIKLSFEVKSSNREKEIFIQREALKNYLESHYGFPADFKGMSCEHIACKILDFFEKDGARWCEVWEEETGGSRVEI